VTTPIIRYLDLERDTWFPAGGGWVFRLSSSDVVTADEPPDGAVEAWLVDLERHLAVVTFYPRDAPVEIRFGWAVADPVAVVRAGVIDVESVCGDFLLRAVPGAVGSSGELVSALNTTFGSEITLPSGLRLVGLVARAQPPSAPVSDGSVSDGSVSGSAPVSGIPSQPWVQPAEGAPSSADTYPADEDAYWDDEPAQQPYQPPLEGISDARPQAGNPSYGWEPPGPDARAQPGDVVFEDDDEPWWRRLGSRLRSRKAPTGRPPFRGTGLTQDRVTLPAPWPQPAESETVILPAPWRPPVEAETRRAPVDAEIRHLVAQMPAGVPTGETVGLQVRIVGAAYDGPVSAAGPLLRAMPVRAGGTEVTVVVHAESGLVADGPLLQSVLVPESGDSDPVLFAFRAVARGLHKVDVKAYAGGSFLGELRAEISVEVGGRRIDAPSRRAALGPLAAVPGEVTLQVQADAAGQYVFQVLSDRTQFSPVAVTSLAGPSGPALEQVLGALSRIARGADYTGSNAREWLRQSGVNLWNQLVPAAVKEQFWLVREQMSAFTIATGHDVVPWELLYPLRPGQDDGFLIEQVPVVRRVFDQARSAHIGLGSPRYVVPSESPADALAEVAAVAARIGGAAGPVIDELDELLGLLARGELGMAHFACHNNYRAEAGGSSIRLRNGAFQPVMLSAATVERSLARHRPLIFINACRSAGEVPQYTQMMGWAKQFMAAGAGAFVGTLWDIRSRSAAAFADGFYQRLADGRTLGEAAHETRVASAHDTGDPTWLAYSVYGDPAATATGETRATG
jgi:hypothetical protein